ncbi:hypothetical protein BD408DRAFT_129558 [Parasitella parasitica]|nr:hypothetical protein BD408DRAFT_129558 [Parasitella parasitica]
MFLYKSRVLEMLCNLKVWINYILICVITINSSQIETLHQCCQAYKTSIRKQKCVVESVSQLGYRSVMVYVQAMTPYLIILQSKIKSIQLVYESLKIHIF